MQSRGDDINGRTTLRAAQPGVNRPLQIEVSDLAKAQIRAAEAWWRLNRPNAPNAIREELERALCLFHFNQKSERSPATSRCRVCVVCISLEFVTTSTTVWSLTLNRSKSSRSGTQVAGAVLRCDVLLEWVALSSRATDCPLENTAACAVLNRRGFGIGLR
jgi:hypothetical protein